MKFHMSLNWRCLVVGLVTTLLVVLAPLEVVSRIALGAEAPAVKNDLNAGTSLSDQKGNSDQQKGKSGGTLQASEKKSGGKLDDAVLPQKPTIKRALQPRIALPLKKVRESEVGEEDTSVQPVIFKVAEPAKTNHPQEIATHEQIGSIVIGARGESPCSLNTFCLTKEGQIIAAVQCQDATAQQGSAAKTADLASSGEPAKKLGELRLFDPAGKALDVWSLPINPTAINVGSDGSIYVGGSGRVLKLDSKGNVLLSIDSPNSLELTANRDAIVKEIDNVAAVVSRPKEVYVRAIEQTKKRVAELEEKEAIAKQDGKQLSRSDKVRLTSARRSVDSLEQVLIRLEEVAETEAEEKRSGVAKKVDQAKEARIAAALESKKRISGIAVTDQDVFVACSSAVGWGYDVWKLDSQLENGKKVVENLRGCCGQMDIQAQGEHLVVAENSMHRVSCYDRAGKLIKNIGERESISKLGFEGCCNPMNCRLGSGGEIYTSESSIGRIRKYSTDGTYLGLVAKASLVSGCKHVAVAVNSDGSKVYLLDVTKGEILIMGQKTSLKTAAK